MAPTRPWGQTLDAKNGLYGPDHQHIFVARLDMAVDGLANRVVEVEAEPAGTSTSDHEDDYAMTHGRLNAFRRKTTRLSSERVAAREGAPQRARHWLVESCERRNGVGEPTAWKLEPGAGSAIAPACDPRAAYLDRAREALPTEQRRKKWEPHRVKAPLCSTKTTVNVSSRACLPAC